MKKTSYYYKNIFLYASLQFSGNIEEYFKNHTENLLVFLVMPRVNNEVNLFRYYHNGKLIKEEKVTLSTNIFIYYFLWYVNHIRGLVKFFPKKEKIVVISFHPLTFFFMSVHRLLRNVQYVYWIGDYFPGVTRNLRLYEKLKKSYHDVIPYSCYLSDKINEKLNGVVIHTANRKTIVWGVKPKKISRKAPSKHLQILFVGLIKRSQGIEHILEFLKEHKDYKVKLLGVCEQKLYNEYQRIISKYNIKKQVYFPNKFLPENELEVESKDCHVGVALYDATPLNASYYADPGKVKSYAELELPVIMSNISDTAKYIKRFHSGEVINKTSELEEAFIKIKNNYKSYQKGIRLFNQHFYFESYYKKSFTFLEALWQNKE